MSNGKVPYVARRRRQGPGGAGGDAHLTGNNGATQVPSSQKAVVLSAKKPEATLMYTFGDHMFYWSRVVSNGRVTVMYIAKP